MKIKTILTILFVFIYTAFICTTGVYAANNIVTISFDPAAPNFTSGQENVITATLASGKGNIAAATLVFQSAGGVKIVKVLDATDTGNTPFTKTKNIIDHTSDTSFKTTILFVKASSDLPTMIKIPVVVSGNTAGNLTIDTKASQVIDENGNMYTLASSKGSTITFSSDGKNVLPPPSPTPLPSNVISLNLALKFQGVNPSDVKTKTIPGVKVQLVSGSGSNAQLSVPVYIPVTMDGSGIWRGSAVFPNSKAGTYALLIKGPKHLQKRICDSTPTETKIGGYSCSKGAISLKTGINDINIASISLMAGDVGIQDGILNAFDLSFVQDAIKKTSTTAVADADVNYDGKVSKADYDAVLYTLANTSGLDQK